MILFTDSNLMLLGYVDQINMISYNININNFQGGLADISAVQNTGECVRAIQDLLPDAVQVIEQVGGQIVRQNGVLLKPKDVSLAWVSLPPCSSPKLSLESLTRTETPLYNAEAFRLEHFAP